VNPCAHFCPGKGRYWKTRDRSFLVDPARKPYGSAIVDAVTAAAMMNAPVPPPAVDIPWPTRKRIVLQQKALQNPVVCGLPPTYGNFKGPIPLDVPWSSAMAAIQEEQPTRTRSLMKDPRRRHRRVPRTD
jgi:hypothetical protein